MPGRLFALYQVPISTPEEQVKVSGVIMGDPGSTHNFVTHSFAKVIKMTSEPGLLSLEVFQGTVEAEHTRNY